MMNKIRRVISVVSCLLISSMFHATRADAAVATATIAVSATVVSFCTIVALPLSFGNYLSTQLDASTTLTVTCTSTTPYVVSLDAGSGIAAGATTTTRKMALLTNTLNYQLFSNAGRTINWGNTTGTDTVPGTGSGGAQVLTVYGRISAAQLVVPGVYADIVTATITY
jgi:spore coat protein U-like protein